MQSRSRAGAEQEKSKIRAKTKPGSSRAGVGPKLGRSWAVAGQEQ